jgi:hypothetical protein
VEETLINNRFESILKARLAGLDLTSANPLIRRVVMEYGALFVARDEVVIPSTPIFESQNEVLEFQDSLNVGSYILEDTQIELQAAALESLLMARDEALSLGLNLLARGGPEAARRDYEDSLRLWLSRFEPALEHWTNAGRIEETRAEQIRRLPITEQVLQVMELESEGLFFSKDLKKSVFYSVAPPGASQHLSLLAFDCAQFNDKTVRDILARYGWYQTVVSDLPHFTYLGHSQSELPDCGLKQVDSGGLIFWIPDL